MKTFLQPLQSLAEIEEIEKQAKKNKKQPFFAYLSFYAVHGPIQTTEENWSHYRNKADSMGIAPEGFKVDRTLPVRQRQDNPIYANKWMMLLGSY